MVECLLPKQDVEGSSPFGRFDKCFKGRLRSSHPLMSGSESWRRLETKYPKDRDGYRRRIDPDLKPLA